MFYIQTNSVSQEEKNFFSSSFTFFKFRFLEHSFLWGDSNGSYTVKNYLHGLHGFVANSQKFVVYNRPRENPKGVNFLGVSSKQFVPNFTVTLYFTTLSLE